MENPRPRAKRKVAVRVLLVAAAGAAVVTLANCGGVTSGNLIFTPDCGPDAGPPGCVNKSDGGTDGGN